MILNRQGSLALADTDGDRCMEQGSGRLGAAHDQEQPLHHIIVKIQFTGEDGGQTVAELLTFWM